MNTKESMKEKYDFDILSLFFIKSLIFFLIFGKIIEWNSHNFLVNLNISETSS
jgi:hypothetical protein